MREDGWLTANPHPLPPMVFVCQGFSSLSALCSRYLRCQILAFYHCSSAVKRITKVTRPEDVQQPIWRQNLFEAVGFCRHFKGVLAGPIASNRDSNPTLSPSFLLIIQKTQNNITASVLLGFNGKSRRSLITADIKKDGSAAISG